MPKSISEILQNDVLTEDVKSELTEAFEQRIVEERERITAELREEFADRYEVDKGKIVEAVDKMITTVVTKELNEFAEDRKQVKESKVKYDSAIKEHKQVINKFIVETLTTELKELRKDIKAQDGNIKMLEDFVVKNLTEEINEFYEDKRLLVEQKVKMIQDGKKIVTEAKEKFIRKSASQLGDLIERVLTTEVKNLYEDIKRAKENEFGRKLFETFATEFITSNLNQGTQAGKLAAELNKTREALSESEKNRKATKKELMESQRNIKISQDMMKRRAIMNELLSPLNKGQRETMTTLLESVKTVNLRKSFEKYLPSIMTENTKRDEKVTLTESTKPRQQLREVNGDKPIQSETGISAEILQLRKLAGTLKGQG